MIKDKYRLNEYIITEYDRSLYTWETHIALGVQRSGNCFVIGNILVLEPWSSEEAGFLKLEFYEHLMKLKVWNKTLYYCVSSALRDVRTGQRFSERLYRQKESDQTLETGIFRLGQYEITVETDCNITWQLYKGANKIATGSCMVESCILFIRFAEKEFSGNQSKKQWLDYLKSLPKWDKTSVWSYRKVLHTCEQERFTEKKDQFKKERIKNITQVSDIQGGKNQTLFKNSATGLHVSHMKSFLNCTKWKQWWENSSPIFTHVLFTGVGFLWFLIRKITYWFRKAAKYFLKHNKEKRDRL